MSTLRRVLAAFPRFIVLGATLLAKCKLLPGCGVIGVAASLPFTPVVVGWCFVARGRTRFMALRAFERGCGPTLLSARSLGRYMGTSEEHPANDSRRPLEPSVLATWGIGIILAVILRLGLFDFESQDYRAR